MNLIVCIFLLAYRSFLASRIRVTFDFPYLPCLLAKKDLNWSEEEFQNVKQQYETQILSRSDRNTLMQQHEKEEVVFRLPRYANEQLRMRAKIVFEHMKLFLCLQVNLLTVFRSNAKKYSLPRKGSRFENSIASIKFLHEQARFVEKQVEKAGSEAFCRNVTLQSIYTQVTDLYLMSLVLLGSLVDTETVEEKNKVLKLLNDCAFQKSRQKVRSMVVMIKNTQEYKRSCNEMVRRTPSKSESLIGTNFTDHI